jgi:hypothetical protein
MKTFGVCGRLTVRVALCTTTALVPLLGLPAPLLAQEVLGPATSTNFGADKSGADQPKAADGPDACEFCIGGDSQSGATGNDGGLGGSANYIFVPNTELTGISGKVTTSIVANGGKGGDGGKGGFVPTGSGFSNGGGAGRGGGGGSVTFAQQGSGDAQSRIAGADQGAVLLEANGGYGGAGGESPNYGKGGQGGAGGDGGSVTFNQDGYAYITSAQPGATAVVLNSNGGNGGASPDARTHTDHASAHDGGQGGNGGEINATILGSIVSAGSGVVATSQGGDGGNGGFAQTDGGGGATGGKGGNGGGGGAIDLTLYRGSIQATGASGAATGVTQTTQDGGTITFSAPTAALQALSLGGTGGDGKGADGNFSKGVGGGGGGVNSNATATVDNQGGSIVTNGYAALGMVAQNIAGNGGNGGYGGGVFVAKGGSGANGGDASSAIAKTNAGSIFVNGDSSIGMLAQSIGGGGGFGAGASVSTAVVGVSLGGNGATGGNAATATVYNGIPDENFSNFTDGSVISTTGYGAHAMAAQAIGGGGGSAGDATTTVVGGILSVGIGGRAGSGGDGGQATVQNAGVVQTAGDDAYGLIAQSVGGGGGDGGAAYSLDIGAQLTVSTAVGGSGGTGGNGFAAGDSTQLGANAGNVGQIVTSGANSYGIVAQSVGGGGGTGGSSFARTIQVYNDPEYPSLTLNVSLGGSGGKGGLGGNVTVGNYGALLTSGAGALGILAQSIGGGGGTGGDADSLNQAYNASTFTVTTTIGGNGGTGGDAGSVFVQNSGFINTAGDWATAITAQSVGGGGGTGGSGSADTGSYNDNEKPYSFQMSLALGGRGGAAGDGNNVTVENDVTGIATYGDNSRGIFAQSVGGGGGTAGGAVAKGGGGANNVNVAVGGSGGGGGNGGNVTVTNNATILTTGGSSEAIYAQSIGGGGGTAGSGTVGEGTSPQVTLAEFIAKGMGIGEGVIDVGNGLYTLAYKGEAEWDDIKKLKAAADYFRNNSAPKATAEGEEAAGSKINVNVGAGFGGSGGAAGNGGNVTVANTGTIETDGAASDGIFAQSVGGGGGDGGAATSANGHGTLNGSLGIGGGAGAAGEGGGIDITNTGSITTMGDLSHGIFAQSIGGGGGTGGVSGGEATAFTAVTINMSGGGGANGDGGAINVANNGGAIATGGNDAIGIVAQSVGGSGGVASVMSEDDDAKGGFGESVTGLIPNTTIIPIKLSGAPSVNNQFGDGSKVTVGLSASTITTQGRDAYGILAQSIGGGGGLVLGVQGEAGDQNFFGEGSTAGDGGDIDIALSNSARIETHGVGAVGILAQSIGGGGGLVGGMSGVDLSKGPTATGNLLQHLGEGGNINIDVEPDTQINTYGTRAHGIFAQAIGSGGGLFGLQDGEGYTMAGRAACVGVCPGTVTINADGFIRAHGADSWGIYAQTQGDSSNGVTINMLKGTGVVDGTDGGIFIDSRFGANVINNNGYISGDNGVAISTNGSGTLNSGNPSGGIVSITGDILSSGGGWNITNNTSSRLYTNTLIQSNAFVNHGEVWLGRISANNVTEITSDFKSDGRIVVGVNFATGKADMLKVDGTATIGGQILINPINFQAGTATIVTANALTLDNPQASNFQHLSDDTLVPVKPLLLSYNIAQTSPTTLAVTAVGDLSKVASSSGFDANHRSVAGHLQELFNGGSAAGNVNLVGNVIASIDTPEKYRTALESLGGHTLGAAAATRATVDRNFTGALESCPAFAADSLSLVEGDCFWERAGGGIINTHADSISVGFDTSAYVFQLGGQKEFAPGWFLGGSLGYENSDTTSDSGYATVRGDALLAGVTLKHQTGHLIVSGAVTGGLGWFKSLRTIIIGDQTSVAQAAPRTADVGVHTKVSYDLVSKHVYIRPQVNFDATRVHMDGFSETGSSYGLDVSSSAHWMISANPALELGGRFQLGSMVLRPWVRGGAEFYQQRDWKMNAQITGTNEALSGFDADTSMPETTATIGAGLDLVSKGGINLKVMYSGELANKYTAHSGFFRLGILF